VIVIKFGGTSVKDAPAMRRAVDIVGARVDRRPIVILSAIAGATNALLQLGRVALEGRTREAQEILAELISRHRWILFDLDLDPETEREVAEAVARHGEELDDFIRGVVLLRELTPRIQDSIVGHGEQLSTLLFTARARRVGLDVALLDARGIIVTDARYTEALPDRAALGIKAQQKVAPLVEAGIVPVTQGFIGATTRGVPTTLGRGGSDYTASLMGAALGAEEIQIWTDVDGMLTADSRIVSDGMKLRELSFAEASELAYFGAKVLHPASIEPAVKSNIPVRILNSHKPNVSGTTITSDARKAGVAVKSIAAKKGISILHLQSLRMLMAHGFMRTTFEILDRYELSVDLVSTSEVSVSLAVEEGERLDEVVAELSRVSKVNIESDCAIVCLVGEGIQSAPGIAARSFGALGDINVRMISQGASEINLSFVVRGVDADDTVRCLHHEFFSGIDRPDLFEPLDVEAIP
jgi:aspartate kinase